MLDPSLYCVMIHQGFLCQKAALVSQMNVLRKLSHCVGYLGIVKKACQAKGCCWLPLVDLDDPIRGGPQLEQPACFYTNTLPSVYQATDVNRTKTSTEVSQSHVVQHLLTSTHAYLGNHVVAAEVAAHDSKGAAAIKAPYLRSSLI